MPAIGVAVAAYAVSDAVAVALGSQILGAVAGAIVGGVLTNALNRPDSSLGTQNTPQGALVDGASSFGPINPVYGRRRVGGIKVFEDTADNSDPAHPNAALVVVVAWCAGPISAVKQIYLDDVPITDARFANCAYGSYTGTATQAANANLIAAFPDKWTAAHQGRGVAYSWFSFQWDEAVFPRGAPNITADIEGALLYDPRDGVTRWSDNPWLEIRDYLTNTSYGVKAPSSMIDDATFITEANYADARVAGPVHLATFTADPATDIITLPAMDTFGTGFGVQLASTGTLPAGLAAATTYYWIIQEPLRDANDNPSQSRGKLATSYANALAGTAIDITDAGTGTHTQALYDMPRYTADGIINIDQGRLENLRALLSSCRGMLVFSGGKYKARTDKSDSAVSFALNEDNILGGWSFALNKKRSLFNRVRANFYDEDQFYQANVALADSTTYRAQDNGTLLEGSIDLPFTTNTYMAAHLAQPVMKQSRFGITVSLTATIAATQLEVGDVVPLTHTTPGWVAKLFRVMNVGLLSSDEVRLTLQEYDASVYTLDDVTYVTPAKSSTLPNPATVAAPGVPTVVEARYQTSGSAGVKSKASVSWAGAADIFVANGGRYQIEYQAVGASAWSIAGNVASNILALDVFDLAIGAYQFRAKSINVAGNSSAYATTGVVSLLGPAVPDNPANFTLIAVSGVAYPSWNLSTALDVRIGGRVQIRWTPKTSSAAWEDGVVLDEFNGDAVTGHVPLMTGTYLCKFRTSNSLYSVTAASFLATEGMVTGFTTVGSRDIAAAGYPGSKTNLFASGSNIKLDSTTTIATTPGNVSTWPKISALGGIAASGSYRDSSYVDCATVAVRRWQLTSQQLSFDNNDTIASRTNKISTWDTISGVKVNDCDITPLVSTTPDDPASAPTWSAYVPFFVADLSCRAARFGVDFVSGAPTHNIQVSALSVTAKIPV